MVAHPKIHMTVGDNKTELKEVKAECIVLNYQINAIPSATLKLAIPGNNRQAFLNSEEISACQPGEKLTLQVDGKDAFCGVITDSFLSLNRIPFLELTLRHSLIALDSLTRSQVFSQQTDAEVLQTLCKAAGNLTINAQLGTKYEQKVQYQCSDWLMVRDILEQNGLWLLPQVEGAMVVKPQPAAKADHTLSGNALTLNGQPQLQDTEIRFSARDQPGQLHMTAWNINKQESFSVTAQPTGLGDGLLGSALKKTLSQETWQMNYSTSPEQAALENYANSLLMNLDLAHVQGRLTVQGSLVYQLGQTLAVSGFGTTLNGKGMITSVCHTLKKSRWTTDIRLGSSVLSPLITRRMPDGLHPGVVQAFEEDPLKLDRFRVSLPVLGQKNNVVWARFAVPYASKKSGFICYPEPGDEVVVSFFDGQPDYPVIIGAMYNPKNPAPLPADKENAVKGLIVSPDDNSRLQWLLNKKDKQVLVTTKEEDKGILFDTGKEQVTLHEGITLKAADNNQLILKKTAELTGESVTVKVNANNHLILDKTVELKGTDVTVQGSSINLKQG